MTHETAKVKLVTIICANEMEDRLARRLQSLGCVHGYTTTQASGRGVHGPRKRGFVDGGNLRIEILMGEAAHAEVMGLLAAEFTEEPLMAFVQDVEAFPREHFAAP